MTQAQNVTATFEIQLLSLENVHITSPYRYQQAVGEMSCGFDSRYGIIGVSSAGPTVGVATAGAPFFWVCMSFTVRDGDHNAVRYRIVRRPFGGSSETLVGTITSQGTNRTNTYEFVDTSATGVSYEYGVYAEAANGDRSNTRWSGYGTTPATNLTTYSMNYYNCAGAVEGIKSPTDILKFFTVCPTGNDRVTYAPRGQSSVPSLPVTCNLTPNYTSSEVLIRFYDMQWNTSTSSWRYGPHDSFEFDRHYQIERPATAYAPPYRGHRRVLATCTAYSGDLKSGISFSVTDRHIVGWVDGQVYGTSDLPWSVIW